MASPSVVKNLPANSGDTRDMSSIPESGRSPGEGKGNPLQYSFLENSMHRGSVRLFFWAPKSLQMVIAALKLKDAYSLEGKL